MCGRYSLAPGEFSEIQLEFQVELPLDLEPRYNIAPTWAPGHEPPIVRQGREGRRRLELGRWWLIPASWRRPLSKLPTAFNARAEDLGEKRFWAEAFDARRCLVPATGWREFSGPSGRKQPHHFHYEQRSFAFAGLWDEWRSPEGAQVLSFAIVTVPANDAVASVHDRMPLVVSAGAYADWLDPSLSGARALAAVRRAPAPPPARYESDPTGNDPRREGPAVIAPLHSGQLRLF